jgi:hypothetical protein
MGEDRHELDPELEAELDKLVAELPPLTDAQLDAISDTLMQIRLKGRSS